MPRPPAPTTPAAYFDHPDAAIRLRFWFGRRLRDEVWMDAADPEHHTLAEDVGAYHVRLSELADAAGVPWWVEVYDPGAETFHRYGTDTEAIATAAAPRPPHPPRRRA
jgi:hypothetical protein